jgi:lipopolysaccharide/colanic/teichoic acid biosynthesis glycosyltransferase
MKPRNLQGIRAARDAARERDRELRRLEQRLDPSIRKRAARIAVQASWRVVRSLGARIKRLIDVLVAAGVLLAASPLLAVVALAIKLTDGGPALFWQTRVGKWGKPFAFPKFRSMVVNAEELRRKLEALNQHRDGVTFKMRRDPRITWIGRLIRRTSIDELPQLWCVLKGDMTLVGPRPALVNEVERYSLDDRRRLDVTPGLTCIWQVSGRSEIPFSEQVKLDVEYIETQSLWEDVRLLLKTIPAVITGRGAY